MKIDNFRISQLEQVYAIGLKDEQITIHSQQTRAICLARLLDEQYAKSDERKKSVCIVGGGLAGLTCALELIRKKWTDIEILERMPDLLAVQNGCDTRWVHPHIINWPDPGSDNPNSNHGVLDWSASTASNVTYNIENQWLEEIKNGLERDSKGRPGRGLSVHLGVTYIHARVLTNAGNETEVEWIRDANVRAMGFPGSKVVNSDRRRFDHIIFASGFGIEQSSLHSYWRNEGHGQLHIDGLQRSYIISGLGDGAISDLLRLTTKHFRPDRVIDAPPLVALKPFLEKIKDDVLKSPATFDLISALLISASKKKETGRAWKELQKHFVNQKRVDTKVFLYHRSTEGFARAFNESPASFFNKLLLFILYKNGAFQYLDDKDPGGLEHHIRYHSIPKENVILRHGANRRAIVESILHHPKPETQFEHQPYAECKRYVDQTHVPRP
ncbi:TPA: FAD-dependent oxidoreductase [Pseudomonas putida]